jgi:rubrerythrin
MKMTVTEKNLKTAFTGESQANRKYLAFAKKADDEEYLQIAKLFRAASAAEPVHAHNHFRIMGGIGDTKQNVQKAIEGETYEFKKMYPDFLEPAAEEGENQASWSFNIAYEVEKTHAELYKKAADSLKENRDLPHVEYFICPVYGNTVETTPPEKCPICIAPRKSFKRID